MSSQDASQDRKGLGSRETSHEIPNATGAHTSPVIMALSGADCARHLL